MIGDNKLNGYKWITVPTHKKKNHIFMVCDILRIVGTEDGYGGMSTVILRNGEKLFCTISETEILELIEDK